MNITSLNQRHPQLHINQLLSTAAAGGRDVDALLTPISTVATAVMSDSPATTSRIVETRPERNLWHTEEIQQMLNIMQSINALELLNDKTIKSEHIFRNVEKLMQKRGYRKKTHVQIWTKWKFLKSTYMTTRRNGTVPKMIAPQIYQTLAKMLANQVPARRGRGSAAGQPSSESNNSLDADSNCGGGGGAGGSGTAGFIISGVEGGVATYTNGGGAGGTETRNDFDMAHPIFGFRLGLVKQEPADTGYETNGTAANSPSDKDSVDDSHANGIEPAASQLAAPPPLHTEFKQETILDPQLANDPLAVQPGNIRRSQRRVNATPTTTTPTPPPGDAPPLLRTLMATTPPPLRIATFAKEAAETTPPPLAIPTPSQRAAAARSPYLSKHSLSEHNSGGGSYMRKVPPLPPPLAAASAQQAIRYLPKDITVHATSGGGSVRNAANRSRDYHLGRSECILPNSPPLYSNNNHNRDYYTNSYENATPLPCNSRQQQQANSSAYAAHEHAKLKRRLEMPSWHETRITPGGKLPRYASQHFQMGDSQPGAPSHAAHSNFDSALKELSVSLRQMQRDMLSDFFDTQMTLARKEHEFQMQQDFMLMQAFQEQTQQLLHSAKQMMGVVAEESTVEVGGDLEPGDDTDIEMTQIECEAPQIIDDDDDDVQRHEDDVTHAEHEQGALRTASVTAMKVANDTAASERTAEGDDTGTSAEREDDDESAYYEEGDDQPEQGAVAVELDEATVETPEAIEGEAIDADSASREQHAVPAMGEDDNDGNVVDDDDDDDDNDDNEVQMKDVYEADSTVSTEMADFHGLPDYEISALTVAAKAKTQANEPIGVANEVNDDDEEVAALHSATDQ